MKHILGVALATILFLGSCTTTQIQETLGVLSGTTSGITSTEAANGLKEALSKGFVTAASLLSEKDGFYGNSLVRIPWPEEAQFVMDAMQKIGMGKQVDKVTLSLNRAAEKASGEAIDVFVLAVKQMTFQDAMGILLGGDGAATDYLKRTTTVVLADKFRPIVDQSLSSVNATKYWSDAIGVYNRIPLVNKKVETDLTLFVTQKALEGVFLKVEEQENNIRNKVSFRNTNLLQKVFGYADSQKQN
ncbi:MAG TPA: DUF4197 domain-containing protein [Chitinophagales bacterium]|nr:DUF4197 domain-containing protein [Chitinophagales bacterium]